jgi:outer membrane protein assembly factor BamB
MVRRRSVLIVGLMTGLLIGCASRPARRPFIEQDQMKSAAFSEYWQAQMPLREGDAVEECYLVDDNLYVATDGGRVFAVAADSGLIRWASDLTERDYTIFPPGHLDTPDAAGPVVFVTTTKLFIFDRYSGDLLHQFPMTIPPGSGAVGDNRRIYLGSTDSHMYSLVWRYPGLTEPITIWRLLTGTPVTKKLHFEDGTLYFATEGGTVAACEARGKVALWLTKLEGGVLADPFVHPSGVYVASLDRSLYCLDRYTGEILWRHRFPKALKDAPKVGDFTCYQYCPAFGLGALETDTGKLKWQREDGLAYLASLPGEAVIRTDGGRIDVVDNETGETKRSFAVGAVRAAVSNVSGDAVYLAAADGRVICVRPEGVPYLRRQQIEAAQATLNRPPATQTEEVSAVAESGTEMKVQDPFRSQRDRR